MADSAVAVTAGTGTNIDTRTEGTNGNHRQVVVLGDPATNAGVAPVDVTSGLKVNLGSDNDVTVTNATAANLKVDGSDVTQPVSGTVTANLGATDNAVLDSIDSAVNGTLAVSGTVTSNLSATDNAVLDSIDSNTTTVAGAVSGGQVQVDIVADGAGLLTTTAHDAAFGTAGAADAQVRSVQGVASMTPLLVDATGQGDVPVTLAGETVSVDLGANNDVTVTNPTAANLKVDGSDVTQPVSGTVTANLSATDNAVLDQIELNQDSQTTLLGTIDTDTGSIATSASTVAGAVSGSEMQVDVVAALPSGTNAIGDVGIEPRTSGGLDIFRSIDIDESEEEIKSTAGQLFSITAFNTTDAPIYLKFYNATAASVTVGTTTPILTFLVPGNANSDGAGFVWSNDIGLEFSTAMTVAATTGVADSDTGSPGANACIVNVGYK